MTAALTDPIFTNEAKAIEHMEHDRWPNGVTCPLCGADRPKKMGGETQTGMFLCPDCRGKFTVRTGTVFERSHIPLHKWLLATHLMASSKKGISAHQLHRMLGITYKSAWFMAHRIREAMAPATGPTAQMGGEGQTVEADETYFGPSSEVRVETTRGNPANLRTHWCAFSDGRSSGQSPQLQRTTRLFTCASRPVGWDYIPIIAANSSI